MIRPPLQSVRIRLDDPAVRDYRSLLLLLVATVFFQRLATGVVWVVSESIPDPLDPQLVGAVVYATLAFAALLAVATLVRRRRPALDRLGAFEWRFAGAITAGLFLLGAYLLHGVADLPAFPDDTVRTLLIGPVALGVPAIAYARVRGIDVDLSFPDRDARAVIAAVVLVAALGAGVVWTVAYLATGTGLFDPHFTDPAGAQFSAGAWLGRVVLPVLFVGLGWSLLYNGAIQPHLRERLGAAGAVAAVTTLLSLVWWTSPGVARVGGPLTTTAAMAGGVLLSLLVALLLAWGLGHARRSLDWELTPATAVVVGVLAVSLVVAVTVAASAYRTALVSWGLGYPVAVAAATLGYERSRSLWVPVAAYATFLLLIDVHVAQALAPLLS